MIRRRVSQRHSNQAPDPDLDRALDAMTAPELRSFVRGVLDGLEDEQRAAIVDSIIARAATGDARWKPNAPSRRVVEEVRRFVEAARRIGSADPEDVTQYLRQGTRAFLAGDYATARAVYDALLPPIANGDIDLGQHEMVDEVLHVDVHATLAQYVSSVYMTTRLSARADAVYDATEQVEGVTSLSSPISEMENVSGGALPDLSGFLPRWVKRLERLRPAKDDWEGPHERWLREAVFRMEGVGGLERVARTTKRPQACLAWCEALVERRDWSAALRAYDGAASLVRKSPWRDELLDGAALASQQLGRSDAVARLEKAWLGAPSVVRLLRWLIAPGPASLTPVLKAKRALKRCPRTDGRQLGLLRALAGDLRGAAAILARAPGLGWSSANHPGHVLFALFAIVLADGTKQQVHATLLANFESTCRDPLDMFSRDGTEAKPALAMPSISKLIEDVRPLLTIDTADRHAMVDAMRVAAEKRIEGILKESRRRYYGHAATLAACCLAVAPKDRQNGIADWIAQLQATYSRRHAFKDELEAAMNQR